MATKTKEPAKAKEPQATEIPLTVTEKQFHQAVGRRKTATCTVRIWSANPEHSASKGFFIVNEMPLEKYFVDAKLQQVALAPLTRIKSMEKFAVSVHVRGGGLSAQAEAVRHGLSRALVDFFPNFRKKLKKSGYMTRDARMVERKKPGLKKARRAPQWSKR